MPRSIVQPSLKSGLVLVALAAMVTFGFVRSRQMPADLPLGTETQTTDAEQIITASIEQDALDSPPSMGAVDSESVPQLASGRTSPAKHPLPPRRSRSPRRGRSSSPMPLSLLHFTFRPEKQLPTPAAARSAMSGKPVAVFAVLRN